MLWMVYTYYITRSFLLKQVNQVNKSIHRTWLCEKAAAMHVYDGRSGFL